MAFETEEKLLSARVEGYIVVGFFIFPLLFSGNFDIKLLVYFYIFILVFFFPLLDLAKTYGALIIRLIYSLYKTEEELKKAKNKALFRSFVFPSFLSVTNIKYPNISTLCLTR